MNEDDDFKMVMLRTLAECRMTEDDLQFMVEMNQRVRKRIDAAELDGLERLFSRETPKEISK